MFLLANICRGVAAEKRRPMAVDALRTASALARKPGAESHRLAALYTEMAFHLLQAERPSRYDGPRPLELIIVTRRARRRIQVDYVEHYAAIPRAEWLAAAAADLLMFVSAGPGAGKSQ